MINTLPAQEIKRRGLVAVDAIIDQGPVHVIKNNYLQYVILTEKRYQELVSFEHEEYIKRVKQSLKDVEEGKVYSFKNADALLKKIHEQDPTRE